MPADFAAQFEKSSGKPIEFNGRVLYPRFSIDVIRGDRLEISFLRFTETPVQGLSLGSENRNLDLECGGTRGHSFALWTDSAPKHIAVDIIRPVRAAVQLDIRNIWRDEKYGSTMYGLNAAAIQVESQDNGEFVLRCSDGSGEPDFNDLVALVRHVRRESVDRKATARAF
jgi:hypothetical protein